MRLLLLSGFLSVSTAFALQAATFTLSDLIGTNGSITVGDVIFSDFDFQDQNDPKFNPLDPTPSSGDIFITSVQGPQSVSLAFSINPAITAQDLTDPTTGAVSLTGFSFLVDYKATISGSTRTFNGVSLALDATRTGDAETEVVYRDAANPQDASIEVETFETDAFGSQLSDSAALNPITMLSLFGEIEGEARAAGSSVSLNGYTVSFGLDGTLPPPEVIPVPAGLPLLVSGLALFAFLTRRKASA